MKKLLLILGVYTLIICLACLIIGTFTFPVPVLIEQDVMAYKLNNGFLFLMVALPSIVITGFIIASAVAFGQTKVPGAIRFSGVVVNWFKKVFIVCVGCTFVLSLAHDVFVPMFEQRKVEFEEKPILINQYLELSKIYLLKSFNNSQYASLATFYSKKVLELDATNEAANELLKRAEFSAAEANNVKPKISQKESDSYYVKSKDQIAEELESIDSTEINKIYGSSVFELIQSAEKLFDAEDYLGAHYYAQMAIKIATPKDVNLSKAKELANKAWNVLLDAKQESLTEENRFFRKKIEGYTKLMAGDYLSAYYIFQTLSNTKISYSRDADVKRYLNIARYELTGQYFFIDETTDKDTFESAQNVYFSLKHNDGSYDIFYVKGITDISESGNLVRYLRELRIYSFDSYGDFSHSMIVPYAKMLAIDVDTLGEQELAALKIQKKWKTVPYLLLCSVDRNQEGVKISPVYLDKKSNTCDGKNQILLPMPYNDFEIISKCTSGIHKMNFWSMSKMKLAASSYGYSNEIILQSVLLSIYYPFAIFAIFLLAASIGWNYRLQAHKVFKFIWIFVFPIVNVIAYGAVGFCEFLIKLLNFIFMGAVGIQYALYVGLIFYILIIVVMSFLFLARKGD